jgi:hypothetical protein
LQHKKIQLIMSFSDLFDSEFKQRNKGHFSSIVRLALADGFCPWKRVLDKLAIRLEISIAEYVEILETLQSTLSTPLLKLNEIERLLYDLARIVRVDHLWEITKLCWKSFV